LTEAQRAAAVALFEKGIGYMVTARLLGVPRVPVKSYSFEFKLDLVRRFLAGESGPDLAVEAGLVSRQLLQNGSALIVVRVRTRCGPSLKAGPEARFPARILAADPEETVKTRITKIFKKSHGRYGHRRIDTELLKEGWTVARRPC
jgi:hypothetical protein